MSELATSVVPEPKSGLQKVWALRSYRLLLSAQLVSDLGDGVYALALIWAMKVLTGSAVQMSMVLTAELIPTIVLGLFAGVAVDLGKKKNIMINADLFRGLIVGILAVLWWQQWIAPWMLVVAAACLSCFSAFFTPARTVTIRTLVPSELMMQAQSVASTVQTVVGLVAPVLAGVLLSVNITLAFLFNALSFFISLLLITRIKHEQLVTRRPGKHDWRGIGTTLKEGWQTILSVPVLRQSIVYFILLNLILAPITVLFPLYATNSTWLAAFEVAFFAGVLSGSVTVGFLSKFRKAIPIASGLLMSLVGFGLLSQVHGYVPILLCMFFAGMGTPLFNIPLNTIFITTVPRDVLGRASSTLSILVQVAKPISLSLTGSLLLLYSVRDLFLGIACFGLVLVVLMFLNPVIRQAE